jgi:hypothetical protein
MIAHASARSKARRLSWYAASAHILDLRQRQYSIRGEAHDTNTRAGTDHNSQRRAAIRQVEYRSFGNRGLIYCDFAATRRWIWIPTYTKSPQGHQKALLWDHKHFASVSTYLARPRRLQTIRDLRLQDVVVLPAIPKEPLRLKTDGSSI